MSRQRSEDQALGGDEDDLVRSEPLQEDHHANGTEHQRQLEREIAQPNSNAPDKEIARGQQVPQTRQYQINRGK